MATMAPNVLPEDMTERLHERAPVCDSTSKAERVGPDEQPRWG